MQHFLQHYLDYYSELEHPQYAILVTGPWGIGKTHQVRKLLPNCKAHYISLFGLTTVSEIHNAVFAEVEPTLETAKKYITPLLTVFSSAMKVPQLNSLAPDLIQAFLRKQLKPEKILIFDDLERSEISPADLLGAINTYVEHHKCRVVLIAHDELFVDDLKMHKEKLIGHTVRVFPQIDQAFDQFLTRCISCSFRSFLSNYKGEIISIFIESQHHSLRLLRSIMDDLSRLYNSLTEKHLENTQAVREMISLHTALNLEVRSGCIAEKDLINRSNSQTRYLVRSSRESDEKEDIPAILESNNKYKDIDLCNNLWNDEVAIEMLIYGVYSTTKIRQSIDNSPYFLQAEAEETASWKLVYTFDQLEDSIVEEAQRNMEDQFRQRLVEEPGEFLHIFALMMMMAEFSVTEDTIDEVFERCKEYVNDLAKYGRLPPLNLETEEVEASLDVYDGFQYWVTDTYRERFGELKAHIRKNREAVLDDNLSALAGEILEKLRENAIEFSQLISFSSSSAGLFAANAVLHNINPKDFVAAWLDNEKTKWHYVRSALEDRYSLGKRVEAERDWIKEVIFELEEAAKRENGFRAFRIRRIIPSVETYLSERE